MKIEISFKDGFHKTTRRLNAKQKDRFADFVVLLSGNPFSPKLHTKALSGELGGLYSFRISREWRVLFKFISPTEIRLLEVGHRKDIYK